MCSWWPNPDRLNSVVMHHHRRTRSDQQQRGSSRIFRTNHHVNLQNQNLDSSFQLLDINNTSDLKSLKLNNDFLKRSTKIVAWQHYNNKAKLNISKSKPMNNMEHNMDHGLSRSSNH